MDIELTGEGAGDRFGSVVNGAGDLNNDGYADLLIGAWGYSGNTGKVYLYMYGMNGTLFNDLTITGEATNTFLGFSVSSAGDVNGDGYSDVIVGAFGYSSYTGRAYIYYGGSSMNNASDVTFTGEAVSNYFGYSVSLAGDVNGDGYSDVIIGASTYSSNTGRAYIFYGGSSMNNAADVTFTGEAVSNYFGCSVSSAGDINGDGYSDVIIGANTYSSNTGRAYIYYGGSSMNNAADVTFTGEDVSNYFGCSVSLAGDVNGDGFSDVIVGAFGYSMNTGRAYIFYGGFSMNNIADIIVTGESVNDYGRSVSSAGDVNGDGLSDIIFGAYNYNTGTGRSYVYFSSFPNVHPNIVSVKDVPLDQGGYVNLKWAKSAYDQQVSGQVTNYVIERSLPPGYSGFNWVSVGTVPATNVPIYNYEARTSYDSSISANGVFFFRVTAYTNNPGEYWRSNMLSGYSRDNLAPLPPVNLAASLVLNSANLTWNANTESDLRQYIIYRDGVQTGISTTLSFTDNTILPDSSYTYRIAAEDIHGNIGPQSNSALITYTVSTINIKVIPEGFYNSSTGMLNMSDTAKAYLHSSASPYFVIDSAVKIIDPVTFTGSFRFLNASSGTYYIVISHRNTIETWSKTGGEVFTSGTTMNYDFTSSSSQAYGSNMIQIDASPVRFGIYSGDVNQDGTIDASDMSGVDNAAYNSLSGYVRTDVTGDNFVDAADQSIVDNNAFNSVSTVRP